MEPVKADLIIELNVVCPECGHDFDMIADTDLNDEGSLLRQTIEDDRWEVDADDRLECNPICPECSIQFEVKGVNWQVSRPVKSARKGSAMLQDCTCKDYAYIDQSKSENGLYAAACASRFCPMATAYVGSPATAAKVWTAMLDGNKTESRRRKLHCRLN
jgi:hypothetical protein